MSLTSNYVVFLKSCLALKQTIRTGWRLRNVNQPESVADHSYQMALMAVTFPKLPNLVSRELAVQMCIVHDLPECIVGDIAPSDGVPKSEKHRREREAMVDLSEKLGRASLANDSSAKNRLLELYNEYEMQESPTAKFVKDLDRLEMCLQASFYQEQQGIQLTNEFCGGCAGKFHFSEVEAFFEEVRPTN